jgi:hypothetical protein
MLARLAVTGTCLLLGACCTSVTNLDVTLAGRRAFVGVNLAILNGEYLTVGDTLTASVEAQCLNGLTDERLYGSASHPDWFSFASTNAGVATIDARGFIAAAGPGRTALRIGTRGRLDSVIVFVSPAVSTVHVSASSPVHVGDTILVQVTAADAAGQPVDSARVDLNAIPTNPALATWADPAANFIGASPVGRATPVSSRMVARGAGTLRITAETSGPAGPHFVAGDTASVDIQPL